MKKIVFAFIFSIVFSTIAFSQEKKPSKMIISAHGWYGDDIEKTRPNLKSSGYMTYEANIGFQTNPADSCYYAQAFGYPVFSVGLSFANMGDFKFHDHTKLPVLSSVYGSFERTLFRQKRVSLGYQLDFGLTYNPERYDPVKNPGNDLLSSPIMSYFGAGVFAKVHVGKRWELGVDYMFRHFSNGRLSLPNEALNAIGVGVFAKYRLSDYNYAEYKNTPKIVPDFQKKMQYSIVLGGGLHTCMAEWNAYVVKEPDPAKRKDIKLKAHPKLSLSGEALYRYNPRYATGIGLDVFYSSNMKELEASDRIVYGDEAVDKCPGYAPFSAGISVVQEVYWRNLAVHVAIGAYPYRHKGVNGPEAKALGDRERGWHYEKAGLRYYMPALGNTFVGFAIKSHSIKAEYIEFSIGVRI